MNELKLIPITTTLQKEQFIKDVQASFQDAYEKEFGKYDKIILAIEDIEESFNATGSKVYFATIDNIIVGGTIIVIDDDTKYNSLHLLYVKTNSQNKGTGYKIWQAIEKIYPETKIWETYTPYYDKRNIHFYVNRCGFKIIEFFNPNHLDPHQQNEAAGNIPIENSCFFRFEKEIQKQ